METPSCNPSPSDEPVADPAPVEPTVDDAIAEAEAEASQGRHWCRVLVAVLGACTCDERTARGVQVALDSLAITAAARLKRILRSDLKR